MTGGYGVVPALFGEFGVADVFSFIYPGVCVGRQQMTVDGQHSGVGDDRSAVAVDKAAEAVPVDDVFFGGYAEFGVGGKDDNGDYGRKVVPALEAVSDGFDVAAVLVDGVEEGVFVTVDVFSPVFAAFIAVNEAGVGFGLDDEDGIGGNDYVVDFGGVSPVAEEQVVDDLVFAAGQAAEDGGNMFLTTAASWDQSAAEKQQQDCDYDNDANVFRRAIYVHIWL